MKLDSSYWEQRYLNKNTAWDLGKVSTALKSIIDKIEDKNLRILIPGAGNAHEARYLLANDFKNVTVIDIALAPLKSLKEEINDPRLRIIHGDFFEHHGSYDIILEQTFFCALDYRFRESYPKKTYELLNKNGILTGVLFNFDSARTEPPFGGNKKEYKSLFQELFVIDKLEICQNSESSREGKELYIRFKKK